MKNGLITLKEGQDKQFSKIGFNHILKNYTKKK